MQKTLSAALALSCLITSTPVVAQDAVPVPHEINFTLTAYYSPLPGQCCYVKGGLVADKILNGNGTHGADGTPVYVGMLAGPPSYAFGTKVQLPGLGVLEVHDRGGAIQVLEGGAVHRLDVWAGYGEEGLARALSFGVQRMKGIVYPPGSDAPAADFALDRIPVDFERLRPYNVVQNGLIDMAPKAGETGLSVAFLQDHLRSLGYLAGESTKFFGPDTADALKRFQREHALPEQADVLDAETAAMLMASVRTMARDMRVPLVNDQSSAKDIAAAQRLLRSMGHYKGRTDGRYSDAVKAGVLAFQQAHALVGDIASPGAGVIGPITQATIAAKLRAERTKTIARQILLVKQVRDFLAERDMLIAATTETGYKGESVQDVQEFLARLGYFPADQINGVFGDLTRASVAAFQVAAGVLPNTAQKGSGVVGPITLKALQKQQIDYAYDLVRGQGWEAL